MSKLNFLLLCLAFASLAKTSTAKQPKSLLNLGLMAAEYIQCPFPYFPIPYGCWCGITLPWPQTHEPVDTFDASCKIHDYCYEEAYTTGCDIWDAYVWDYDWSLENGEITCAKNQDHCQKAICECDKEVIVALEEERKSSGCPPGNPGCPDDRKK